MMNLALAEGRPGAPLALRTVSPEVGTEGGLGVQWVSGGSSVSWSRDLGKKGLEKEGKGGKLKRVVLQKWVQRFTTVCG